MKKYKQLTESEMAKSKNKFRSLVEYTFITKPGDLLLDEDDEIPGEGDETPADGSPMPPMRGEEMPAPAEGGEQPDQSLPAPAPAAGQDIDMEIPGEQPDMAIPEEGGEIEVDVTQLAQDQEETINKVDQMANQTTQMMDLLANITSKVDQIISKTANSENEMGNIKHEIEKRNPTSKEILQKRVTMGNPFNQSPEDYWKKKEAEGHYKLEDEDEKEYELRNSDIDDGSPMDVYRSFGLKDDEINQSIDSIFGN